MKLPYFCLVGVALLAAGSCAWSEPLRTTLVAPPDDIKLAREIFKELVEINTTHAFGSTGIAQAIQKRLLAAGYSESEVTFLAPAEHPTKGNLLVRIHGKTNKNPAMFIGHLDVVEAKSEDWSVDPFKLTEKDGYFYGRGTIDMKDGDAALIESLIRLKRENFKPDRDILFAFTADEEPGGDANGPAWLISKHRDLIDASEVLNMDGGGGALKNGAPLYLDLGVSEKIYTTFKIEATSPGGHGSLPGPDNAIYRISDGLSRLETYKFPVMMSPTTQASFTKMAALEPGADSNDMLAVAKPTTDLAAAERLSGNVFYNAQLRTTCVATLFAGGHAENALPQRAQATIQCRMLPGDTVENVQRQIMAVLADPKISLTLDVQPIKAPESPITPAVTGKIEKVMHSFWPNVPVVPTMETYFTDGRQFRNAGMPTYGASGIWKEATENRAHGRDERVSVAAFDESIEFTYRLIKAFGEVN
jgi:acetylornithine deacetylase/succinyl-diaminopimelate desuccinylase-like protein